MIITATFDDMSPEWTRNAETNRVKLRAYENYYNHQLQCYGFVFLNEIYQSLGMNRTRDGQIIGWIDGGVSYIDFGIDLNKIRDIYDPVIQLEFNPDGEILDLFEDIVKARRTKDN